MVSKEIDETFRCVSGDVQGANGILDVMAVSGYLREVWVD